MTSNQENKVSMYYKVRTFFANNQATIAANVTALPAMLADFNTRLTALSEHDIEATTNISGYATQKTALRGNMRDRCLEVAGALKAFFFAEKDNVMYEKVSINKSTLDKSRDTDALFKCKSMYIIAHANAASILPYGVSAAKLTALNDAIEGYEAFIQNPRDQRSLATAAGQKVDKDITEIDDLLVVVDGMMDSQASDFPALYTQYKLDRAIDDESAGNRSAPEIAVTIAPNTIQSIYTITFSPNRSFKVKNNGNANLHWGLSHDPHSFSHPFHVIEANGLSTKLSSTLGFDGEFLVFQNTSSMPIAFEVSVLE